jgi:alpha-mannosidase
MNTYWDTTYRADQGGRFSSHYVITSAASTGANDLSSMGWDEITPLETDLVTSQDKAVAQNEAALPAAVTADSGSQRSLDGKQGSFLKVDDPNVLLETWKPAEDGDGTILRFLDLGGAERTVTVRTPTLHVDRVTLTDAVERGATAVPLAGDDQFHFTIHPHEIVTLRMVAVSK